MFLTRIDVNLGNRLARRDVADAYEMHSTLARLMSASDDAPAAEFLWRGEANGTSEYRVLVQSEVEPRADRLDGERRDWARTIQTKAFDLQALLVTPGCHRFRLRANPSVCRAGKRHGLLKEEEQRGWIERKAEANGLRILSVGISQPARLVGHRRKGGGNGVTVYSVLFDGLMEVADPVKATEALKEGIGRAKHMGLGLLSLAPVAR